MSFDSSTNIVDDDVVFMSIRKEFNTDRPYANYANMVVELWDAIYERSCGEEDDFKKFKGTRHERSDSRRRGVEEVEDRYHLQVGVENNQVELMICNQAELMICNQTEMMDDL